MQRAFSYLILGLCLLGTSELLAAPRALTYQGRIVKADGQPLQHNNVSFQFEITNDAGTCVLYREQVNGINMQNSNGIFDVAIGNSHSYPASASFTILDSFSNSNPLACDGGAPYLPGASDGRRLRVQFHDGTSWRLISPDSLIRSVPYSAYSANAGKLGDFVATDYVRKAEINGNSSCNGGSFLTWDSATGAFGCAAAGGGGGGAGSVTDVLSANGYITIANSSTTPTLTLRVGTAANTVAAGNDPRLSDSREPSGSATGDLGGNYPSPTVVGIQGVSVDATAPTSGQVLKYDGTNWTAATLPAGNPGTVTQVQSGNSYVSITNPTTTPTLTLNVGTIANTVAAGNDPRLSDSRTPHGSAAGDLAGTYPNPSVAKIQGVAIDPAAPTSGQVLQYNGFSWIPTSLPAASSGTVMNVQSANAYLSITDPGTTPTLTLNVGTSANTVAAGDDSRFSNARTPTGSAGGDLGGTYPNPSVTKIQGVNINSTVPTTGQVLKFDGSSWTATTLPAGNAGTVTSIATGPGLTGGPITSSGTIGLGTELAGLAGISTNGYLQRTGAGVYSTTGASASASSDTLVLRDGSGSSSFYGVNLSGATSGSLALLVPNILTNYSLTLPNAQGGANQVLQNNGSGILSWASVPTAPGANCGANEVITYSGGSFTCVPDQTGSAGSGITTFNGQTGSSQSFGVVGTTGTAPAWSSASSVHTLNIPMANAASVTAGLISKAEYDVFNGKQNALGYTPLRPSNNLNDVANVTTARSNLGLGTASTHNVAASGDAALTEVVLGNDSRLTNGRAPTGTAGGDLSGTYPNPEVAKLDGTALAISGLTNGHFLKYDGANWINALVGISDISGLSTSLNSKLDQSQISGTCTAGKTLVFSAVSGTWTCTNIAISSSQVTFTSQTANRVFIAPNGADGVPTFRALVEADLPTSITQGAWSVNGSHVYRPSGSIGIGTSSPTQVVDIARSNANAFIRIANDSSTANRDVGMVIENYRGTNFGSDNYFYFRNAQGSQSAPTATKNGNTLGGFYFQGQGTTAGAWRSGASILAVAATGGADFTDTNSATDIYFQTNNGSAFATRMVVDATGNVGIGTSTPTSLLQVVGGVQVGNDTATCAAAKAGTLRYASGVMSLCNGSSWVALSSTVGTVTSVATGAGLTGGTITSSGTISVATGGITSAMILDGTIAAADIATDAVTASEIAANAVTSSELASNAVTSVKITDGTIVAADIAADAVTASEIAANAVTSSELASNAVSSAKIVDLTIVEADLAAALSNRIWSGGNGTAVWHTTGNVGIGTTAPTYDLHVVGDVAATAFLYTSDRRLKENIQTLENPLGKVLSLRGVSFDWKRDGAHDIGFIAQEVEEVVPAAVSTRTNDKGEETKSVKYGNLVGLVVEAIKELYQRLSSTDEEVQNLKIENAELKNRLNALEERLNALEKRTPASGPSHDDPKRGNGRVHRG